MIHRWRAWLLRMVPLSEEYPSERAFNAPLFLLPRPNRATPARLGLDLAALLRAAADGPPDLRTWALEGVQASAALLTRFDPVLALLLSRSALGPPVDAREVALLAERLGAVAQDSSLLHRWTLALRRAFAPVLARGDQLKGREPCVVFRVAKVNAPALLSRCKLPVLGPPVEPESDPVASEARWLLSCDSARLGVRRSQGRLLVHVPAYLLVSRLLGRPVLGSEGAALPAVGADKAAWFSAASRWAEFLTSNPGIDWCSGGNPHAAASALGWAVAADVPMLYLSAEAVEAVIGGRTGALPAVARAVPSPRGQPAHLTHTYEGVPLLAARRKFRSSQPPRYYFELPFDVPDTFVPRRFQALRVNRRRLYDLGALARLSEVHAGDFAEFYFYARQLEERFRTDFDAERLSQRHQRRVEQVLAGERARLGPFTSLETETVRAVLANRPPGVIKQEFWEGLASLLPGRSLTMVRRLGFRVIEAEAARVSWPEFRAGPFWPGGDLSRALFAKHGRRTASSSPKL